MYQRLVLVGNLGRDPETHYSSNGIPIANFSVATNHKWTDVEGQTQEETVWFRVAAYGKLAETCQQYLSKGQKVLVEGTLVADPKNGGPRVFARKDGSTGTSFEVRALTVRFLSSKSERANGSTHAASEAEQEPLFSEEPF
ncbi:MAG TPA: single-stranded DNA-binding protein [Anaerolineae bacterium]|nr:single-stranded DNA-binding protein [Anaerolineae bacterium]